MAWATLPAELLDRYVFPRLDAHSLAQCEAACRAWRHALRTMPAWRAAKALLTRIDTRIVEPTELPDCLQDMAMGFYCYEPLDNSEYMRSQQLCETETMYVFNPHLRQWRGVILDAADDWRVPSPYSPRRMVSATFARPRCSSAPRC